MDITPTPLSPLPRKETLPRGLFHQLRKTPSDMLGATHPSSGISYKILGKPPKDKNAEPAMTANTSAIYIGKLCPLPLTEELPHHTFGFQAPERIYGDEFIKACLDYGFNHTPAGEKVRVVICPSLSALLNGPSDMDGAYTLQEEAQRIYTIAALSFPKRLPDLELVPMEQILENQELFQHLSACKDPVTGEVDIGRAYGANETGEQKLSASPTALEIARFLYQAAQKNERLQEIFLKMRPEKVRTMNYPESSKYYGLTEIAIRLRAILSGQKLHIGAERQDVYDKWIAAIVRGENQNGQFRNFSELYPLYALFEGKTFETVHVHTRNNAFRRGKDKKLALARAFIFGSIINCLALGGLELYRHFSNPKAGTMPSQTSPSEADKTPDARSELP